MSVSEREYGGEGEEAASVRSRPFFSRASAPLLHFVPLLSSLLAGVRGCIFFRIIVFLVIIGISFCFFCFCLGFNIMYAGLFFCPSIGL